jgi:hypothetical protein
MRIAGFCVCLLFSLLLHAQSPALGTGKLYAVIFDVTVDSLGAVTDLRVAKVIDPSTRSTDAVKVDVPDSYLKAARTFLMKRKYDANPNHFNTYLFYDPSRPTVADIDPHSGQP